MANLKVLLKEIDERKELIEKAKENFSKIKENQKKLEADLESEKPDEEFIQEPAEFEACVKNGGRVRTKDLGDGKFMRICFIDGKSFAGEVETKKSEENKWEEPRKNKLIEEGLSVTCKIKEKRIDEMSRTVIAGVLEGDSLSANGRFYPIEVVKKASESLSGKKSLIGHDTQSPEDVVAIIERAQMDGRLLTGTFRFGKDAKSEMIFQKVRDGLIDSVSIRGNGETKRAKMGDEFVDVVENLDIFSVDWVLEGGVSAAKVVKVFESKPVFTFNKIEEDNKMEIDELKKQMAEKEKQIEEMKKQSEKDRLDLEESKKKAVESELDAYKSKKLTEVKDDELRALVSEHLTGNTNDEIDIQFKKQIEYFQKLRKKAGLKESEVIIVAKNTNETEVVESVNGLLESNLLNEQEKVKVLCKILG